MNLFAGPSKGTGENSTRGSSSTSSQPTVQRNAADNAQKTSTSEQVGQTAASAAGGVFLTVAVTAYTEGHHAKGALFTGMAITSWVVSANMAKASKKSNKAFCDTSMSFCQGSGSTENDSTSSDDNKWTVSKKNLEDLEKKTNSKVDLDKGTLTTRDGKTYGLDTFTSAANMKKAGFNEAIINSALQEATSISQKTYEEAINKVTGMEEAGGGGGGMASAVASLENNAGYVPYTGAAQNLMKDDRSPNSQGLSKNYGDGKIGFASDSLFDMMNRRYNLKDQQGFFIKAGN